RSLEWSRADNTRSAGPYRCADKCRDPLTKYASCVHSRGAERSCTQRRASPTRSGVVSRAPSLQPLAGTYTNRRLSMRKMIFVAITAAALFAGACKKKDETAKEQENVNDQAKDVRDEQKDVAKDQREMAKDQNDVAKQQGELDSAKSDM